MVSKETNTIGNMHASITNLIYYPLKSGYPINADKISIMNSGIELDRVFSLVNPKTSLRCTIKEDPLIYYIKLKEKDNKCEKSKGKIFTIQIPKSNKLLAESEMLKVECNTFQIELEIENSNIIKNAKTKETCKEVEFIIFKNTKKGYVYSDSELQKALNEYMGKDVILVYSLSPGKLKDYLPYKAERVEKFNEENSYMNYQDAAPLLIIQEEDMDELNEKIKSVKVSYLNFRPNIVLKGISKGSVEKASTLVINGYVFKRLLNCERCKLITFDLKKAEFVGEILDELSDYKFDDKTQGTSFGGYYYLDSKLVSDESQTKENDNELIVEIKNGDKVEVVFN